MNVEISVTEREVCDAVNWAKKRSSAFYEISSKGNMRTLETKRNAHT